MSLKSIDVVERAEFPDAFDRLVPRSSIPALLLECPARESCPAARCPQTSTGPHRGVSAPRRRDAWRFRQNVASMPSARSSLAASGLVIGARPRSTLFTDFSGRLRRPAKSSDDKPRASSSSAKWRPGWMARFWRSLSALELLIVAQAHFLDPQGSLAIERHDQAFPSAKRDGVLARSISAELVKVQAFDLSNLLERWLLGQQIHDLEELRSGSPPKRSGRH